MSRPSRASRAAWLDAVEADLGVRITRHSAVAGGDIGDSHRVELASGERLFVKSYATAPPGMAEAEARGLAWLDEAEAMRVARVRGVGTDWLALDWIDSARPAPDYDEQLGRGLARLHSSGAPRFGFEADNWIGPLPQVNAPVADWPAFYAARRIEPLHRRARDAGALPAEIDRRLDRLLTALPELIGPEEPPARLHGDLWGGNVVCDEAGAPCLIDPAVYGGHREVDLAMMQLFGGFAAGVYRAYRRETPLAPGAAERVALYQVYPLLVHVCLFGSGYLTRLAAALEAALDGAASTPATSDG